MSCRMYRLLVKNLKQIVQIVDDDVTEFLIGDQMNNIKVFHSIFNKLIFFKKFLDPKRFFQFAGDFSGYQWQIFVHRKLEWS